ncbi:hypothetical protein AB0M35_11435 [Micromonospora sp. NPDC051196]
MRSTVVEHPSGRLSGARRFAVGTGRFDPALHRGHEDPPALLRPEAS